MPVVSRVPRGAPAVALETTLLLHGVPKTESRGLADDLARVVREAGGVPTVGVNDEELGLLLAAEKVSKVNTSNLGVALHRKTHAATTVSTTMELAAAAGVRVFATGGLGGVHKNLAAHLDISADLAAFTRFPVAVVTSGVKSLLDVEGTREALETLGVPVVGYRTDRFPAFYLRESAAGVDARFDDHADLARFVSAEMRRTGRGVVVCNPIPAADEIAAGDWRAWLAAAEAKVGPTSGRDATPRLLGALHEVSRGATLRANLALVRSNAALAGRVAASLV
jgi:pseudouridylate synthase